MVVGHAAEVSAQKLCDELREISGARSVVAAVESATPWTGVEIDYAKVTLVGEVGEINTGEETLLAFEIEVEVMY